jgi:dihydrodiol dehydrogenase / D-xylose 1-dehydrogenase (NADP)
MQERNNVRWAILGAGRIAHKFAQDFGATQRGQLVAVASTDKARAQAFADQYRIPAVYSYEELYKRADVDAVYIATTHNFHYEQSLHCINHGKAVLCEKPVTINDAEFKKLAAAAKANKVFFMEAMWTYFLPALHKAKAWLDSGRIGALRLVQADFGFAMPYQPEGRLFNPALAGGSLLDLGVYTIAFAGYFAGHKPDQIVASGIIGKTGVDETTAVALKYDSVMASLTTSITTRLRNSALLFGDAGHIELPYFWKGGSATLYNGEHDVVETFNDDRTTWGYDFEIKHATDAILQGALESDIVPHAVSNSLQELMTEVRRQIGFSYPMER